MKDIINIIYAITVTSFYWIFLKILEGDLLRNEKMKDLKRSNNIVIGKSEKGLIYHNFRKFSHMIVAGTTGYGKTNFIKTMISQLDGTIYLIDLKGGFDYGKVSATNIHEARNVLHEVVSNMKQLRKEHIYVIIDEAGELLPPSHFTKKESWEYLECLTYVSEIARLGRGFHVHLIYCTQYPTRDILNGQVKQNAETRICFRLPTQVASLVALDEEGAEQLPTGNKGLGIYKRDNQTIFKAYEFVKYEGWNCNVKIGNTEKEGAGNNFIIE